jgi:hypothetical protein
MALVAQNSPSLDQLLNLVPQILGELATEFVRVGGQCMDADSNSQKSACFLLAIRSVSLLLGMKRLLDPATRDSWDVLTRGFMESKDLLLTFRFDDDGVRNSIKTWFEGKNDGSWKARHKKAEAFVKRIGAGDTELGKRWSAFSTLSHPTVHAAKNSANFVVTWVTGRSDDTNVIMVRKTADYLISIAILIVATTFDFPEWVPLGCDLSRMPDVEHFRLAVFETTRPIVSVNKEITLPSDSYRSS